MKTEFIDVSDTQKNLVVEIDSTVVDAEIEKIARDYSKAARIPGFRPGKVPAKVVRQRFRDQILHDVVHGLIPRAVDEALRDKGIERSLGGAEPLRRARQSARRRHPRSEKNAFTSGGHESMKDHLSVMSPSLMWATSMAG